MAGAGSGEQHRTGMAERTHRILLVEDDESIRESVRHALQERGYEVIIARDGAEGLMRVERDAPDLMILDMIMPRRSGLTVLERLHRSPMRRPKIIMVSAIEDPRQREFALSRGADRFILKPFDLDDLANEVDSLLR